MSPRAACRLEALGFTQVHDYIGGISDWSAAGLGLDGVTSEEPQVAQATRSDVPTCRGDEPVDVVRSRISDAGWDTCVVVDCDGIVVGRIRPPAIESREDVMVEEVMEPGPSTVRPDSLLGPLVERMEEKGTPQVLVTTPQGRLVGILFRQEAGQVLAGEVPTQIWRDCEGCPGHWAAS